MALVRYRIWVYVKSCGDRGGSPSEVRDAIDGTSLETISTMLRNLVHENCLARVPQTYKGRTTYRYVYEDGLFEPSPKKRVGLSPSRAAVLPVGSVVEPLSPTLNAFLGIRGVL
jgi:hypothetical protein